MSTIKQLVKSKRQDKSRRSRSPSLRQTPHKRGLVYKTYIEKPKKPNSAMRKCCKVYLTTKLYYARAYIRGEGHSIQQHASILVEGGRVPDLSGMRLKVIRGKDDASPVKQRKTSRSKYGVKVPVTFKAVLKANKKIRLSERREKLKTGYEK